MGLQDTNIILTWLEILFGPAGHKYNSNVVGNAILISHLTELEVLYIMLLHKGLSGHVQSREQPTSDDISSQSQSQSQSQLIS